MEENRNIIFDEKKETIHIRVPKHEIDLLRSKCKQNGVDSYAPIIRSLIFRFNRNLINFM
ncbi:hypothetical protein [Francisella frigiditurris]|uniref:Uncharacterized protein n=1 Tax=Francisella frigiditurris TaxID=1542390 RepID=A0A1J0KUC7_9GAMM|nr:hypothetical protein [Francisella frigiditurris]APC97353.1 hypothetical protein KX01_928 [Francisella frigiditurris]